MESVIVPSPLKGKLKAPSSKSMTQRAIAAALLASGESIIMNPSYCNDSLAAISIAEGLGATVKSGEAELKITGSAVLKGTRLNCGESGLAIRMFSPVASLCSSEITISGTGSLSDRPMSMIEEALTQFGVVCNTTEGHLPVTIRGPLRGGQCEIDGSVSSQLLTGLLMALPVTATDSVIKVKNLRSKPYIDMTIQVLENFGIKVGNSNYTRFTITGNQKYKATIFDVESDWSSGAFLLVAGTINGDVTIKGLSPGSRQSDKAILTALDKAGARMDITGDSISIKKSALSAFEFDATESPDLFPPLVTLASYSKGVSEIIGVSRLTYKESNRAETLREEFSRLGIDVKISGDLMLVTGGKVTGAHVNSHSDHRIAMAMAVAGLGADSRVYIKDSQCVAKSYPDFFKDLVKLGAVIYQTE